MTQARKEKGSQPLYVAAEDAAGNGANSAVATARIDNTAPGTTPVAIEGGEAWLLSAHIGQYSHGGYASHDPVRRRKLLLNQAELNKLLGKTTEKGLTIVPLRMYFKKGRIKLAIALAKGKKQFDKRETIRRRESERETRAAVKSRRV